MTTAKAPVVAPEVVLPRRLELDVRALEMSGDDFLQLCADNGDLRLELTAEKELIIMPPTGLDSGGQEQELGRQVGNWAIVDGTGRVFGPNAGYTLPNGAVRAPDVSWMPWHRWESLSREDRAGFGHTFPDFVIELRSPSDRLAEVQGKMAEYIANGVRLGWLIDPRNRRVYVYRSGQPVELLEAPAAVSGEPVLPGFTLDLSAIFR